MTTIATDGKTMAGDGLVCQGELTIAETEATKVFRVDGVIFGLAGKTPHIEVVRQWIKAGRKGAPAIKGSSALLLLPDGSLLQCDEDGSSPCAAPAAIGSGKDHALTAMDMGADAEKAVEMAARRDPFTGGKITVLAL